MIETERPVLTVNESIVRTLVAWDVGSCFSLMGEDTAKLIAAIAAHPALRNYTTRHDATAVSMAEGFARAAGNVGVAVLSRGPGFTNGLTSMVNACKAGSRVLVITGDSPVINGVQETSFPKHLRQEDIAGTCGIDVFTPDRVQSVTEVTERALERAASGRVVLLNVPANFFDAEIELPLERRIDAVTEFPTTIGEADLDRIVTLLTEAGCPLILAGRGAVDATRALVRLADATDALLGTSLMAKDAFFGEPGNVGVVGGFSHPRARSLLDEVDVVVAFGASLNTFTTGGRRLFQNARVCHVALEPGNKTGLVAAPEVTIAADSGAVADMLLSRLPADVARTASGWRTRAIDTLTGRVPVAEFVDQSTATLIDPRTLMCVLNEQLPGQRTITVDGGHHAGWPALYVDVPSGRDAFYCLSYSALGIGPGTALGVALARPEQLNVLFVGDGGLYMTLGELETATRYRIPVLIVVVNDGAFGAEAHFLEMSGAAPDEATFGFQDIVGIARGVGAEAALVRTVAEAEDGARLARDLNGPLVLDCRVNPNVRAEWLVELFSNE